MIIGTNSCEEGMATIKAKLEMLVKGNEEKEACIKLWEEKITRLARKQEKRSDRSFVKSSESKKEDKASAKAKLLTRRCTQRKAVSSRTTGLQA